MRFRGFSGFQGASEEFYKDHRESYGILEGVKGVLLGL